MPLRSTLFDIYRALQNTIVPGLQYSHRLYESVLDSHVNGDVQWLDLGCGHHVLPPWRGDEEEKMVARCGRLIGIDADLDSLIKHRSAHDRVLGSVSLLPFRDESFDLVTANMVIEHLDVPETQFREVARILKPGGVFILHTVNRLGYTTLMARAVPERLKKKLIRLLEGREEEDVFKTFYRVNTARDIEHVADGAGFEVQQLKMTVTTAEFVVFPPLVVFELMWIRVLMANPFKRLRTNIIGVLRKRPEATLRSETPVQSSSSCTH